MPGDRARGPGIGLAVKAGPFPFAVSALAVTLALVPSLRAQDYIDVEAERRAAQTGSPQPLPGELPTGSATGAVSYGIGAAQASSTRTLPPPPAPAADNVGGLFNQVQQLQQEVMRLNGLVEQQAYELRQLKEQSLERYLDLDRRLASGGGPGMPTAASGSMAAEDNSPATPAVGSAPVAEQPGEGEAYRAAYALVRGQEFGEAVDAFNTFLRNFPDGRYAPNAHYWLGELYLVVEPADPEAARQSFTLLLNEYPDNAKVPDALYKLGRVQYIKGNSVRAREYLDRVIREFPDSSAARLARDFKDQNL